MSHWKCWAIGVFGLLQASGCAAGADSSTEPSCVDAQCVSPPDPLCVDAKTLRSFGSEGACAYGACSYPASDSTCPNGCVAGACAAPDACSGVVCRTPPAPRCNGAGTLRSYAPVGSCAAGSCQYAPRDVACANGCSGDACVGDPCSAVTCSTPPPSTCADSKTLRSYASAGTCQGGNCSYVPTDTTCANGCSGGACAGDPCAGVTCSTPPANSCTDAKTLRSHVASGTCAGGTCSYTATSTTCAFGCNAGACVSDPCAGLTCSTPPASSCIAANTLRSYAPAGICASGTCSYSATSTTCSFGCSGGACLADPCAGITCTTPPAPTCVGASRRTYGATGTCSAGVCSYPATDTACTAPASGTTGTCAAGACGYTCNAGLSSCGGACVDLGTNPKNCGVCGHDCLGGACAAGSCQALTLASGEESPWGIALDDTSVYFTNFGGGTIRKVPKAGGSTVTLASGSAPSGIAIVPPGGVLAAGSVVWTESNGGVYTVPASGGARVAIQPEVSAGSNPKGFPAGLAVDASNVYWVDNAHATVYRAPLAGGPRTALSDPYVQPLGLYLSGGEVFWTQYGASGTIRKAPIAGGPSQVLTPAGAPNASSVFVDGFDVFFATFNDVSRVSTVGGAASVLASPGASPGAVAADASNVYFLQNDGYELWRMPRAGGAATRLFEDSSIAGSCNVYAGAWVRPNLVVDKDAIYWAHCGAGGRVLKLAK